MKKSYLTSEPKELSAAFNAYLDVQAEKIRNSKDNAKTVEEREEDMVAAEAW